MFFFFSYKLKIALLLNGPNMSGLSILCKCMHQPPLPKSAPGQLDALATLCYLWGTFLGQNQHFMSGSRHEADMKVLLISPL